MVLFPTNLFIQDLLSEYMSNQGRSGGPELETALDKTAGKVGDLRRQLSRAVVDHVSGSETTQNVAFIANFYL